MVVLTFALTIHEMQGQTLSRIILLLGRMPGMNIGKTTWNLLYVALSRTKRLSHVKFFPTGSTKYYHSMYFAHLLKLSMPTNLKRWLRSYVKHCWDRNVLRIEHLQSVRKVEKKLKLLGKDKTMKLKWDELHSLVKQIGRKATTRDNKTILFCILKEHMVKRLLWNTSKDSNPAKRKGNQRRKRSSQEVRVEKSEESNSSLRRSKRLKGSRESKEDHEQRRRTTRILSSRKRRPALVDLPSRTQKKQHPRKKKRVGHTKVQKSNISNMKHEIVDSNIVNNLSNFVSQESHTMSCKGLCNLGNSCYFNSIVQCLYQCPSFREAIVTVTADGLRVAVVKQLQILFVDMAAVGNLPYINPRKCLTAAMNIPECKRVGMKVGGRQQDASEFLVHLLEHFHQKYRLLSDIFEGQLVSTHTCQHCFYSYTTNQPFKLYTLQMDLPSMLEEQTFDLYKLIDHFHRATILRDYRCRQCDTLNSTEKEISIIALPRVLVILLSRFRGLQKVNKYVSFPAQTSIRYNIDGNEYNKQYRIMGIVVHIGSSKRRGHYIAYVRDGERWFQINDHIVSAVRWSTVRKQKAYLIFFEQI